MKSESNFLPPHTPISPVDNGAPDWVSTTTRNYRSRLTDKWNVFVTECQSWDVHWPYRLPAHAARPFVILSIASVRALPSLPRGLILAQDRNVDCHLVTISQIKAGRKRGRSGIIRPGRDWNNMWKRCIITTVISFSRFSDNLYQN